MKFIHIADVHIGAVPDKGMPWSEERGREIVKTFEDIVELANQEKVDLLLIAGDLFHFPPTVSMLKELDATLCELKETTTVFIAGNHDYRGPGSPLDRYEFESDTVCLKAREPERMVFDDLQTCITGISYDKQEIHEPMYDTLTPTALGGVSAKEKGYCQILLAHGGDATHSPMNLERMGQSGFDYIALGHIHKPEIVVPDHIIYVGSLEPIDCNDIGPRGYVLGEATATSDGWKVCAQWKEFSCRQYVKLSVMVEPDWTNYHLLQEIKSTIEATGEEHIYRLQIEGQRSEDLEIDLEGLKKLYHIYDIQDHTQLAYDYEGLMQEHANDILGSFIASFIDKEDPVSKRALAYGVEALLRG